MLANKIILCLLAITFVCCNQANKQKDVSKEDFFQPPIANANVSYSKYSVGAGKADTIFHTSGSILLFPENAFVDKDGNIVEGKVDIQYREFSTPLDIFLSGINMHYDSANTKNIFESSGMWELLAYKDREPVFVNPKNKPTLHYLSNSGDIGHNVYFTEPLTKKWIYDSPSYPVVVEKKQAVTVIEEDAINKLNTGMATPIKPQKANNLSPVINVMVDKNDYPELAHYNNLKFQIDLKDNNFNPKDTSEDWNNVELQKSKTTGKYILKFSSKQKIVIYNSTPVLEGGDYEKAIKIYDQNLKLFQAKKIKNDIEIKKKALKYQKDSLAAQKLEEWNKKTEELNQLINARAERVKEQNLVVEEVNDAMQIFRSAPIAQFGIGNYDKPINYDTLPIMLINATFKDKNENLLDVKNLTVYRKDFISILRSTPTRFLVFKDVDNMIVCNVGKQFAFLSYKDYQKMNIDTTVKEKTFILTVIDEKNSTYENIKSITQER